MVPKNLNFLQLTISPLEYTTFMHRGGIPYYERLPTYLIARCPLCGASYTSKLDTHSLHAGWGTNNATEGVYFFTQKYEQVGCDHRVAVQKFVNLEGHVPSELKRYLGELHVPFVTPFFVPDDITSALAVIHSFTLCRLEDKYGRIYNAHQHAFEEPVTAVVMRSTAFRRRDQRRIGQRSTEDTIALKTAVFVPYFTAYAVTYYAEDPQILIDRRIEPQRHAIENEDRYWPAFLASMREMADEPHAYDLPYWVKQGKLQWLDLESPDLPLKSGPAADFPYINIQNYVSDFGPLRF